MFSESDLLKKKSKERPLEAFSSSPKKALQDRNKYENKSLKKILVMPSQMLLSEMIRIWPYLYLSSPLLKPLQHLCPA
jgi:hypothetical protein